MRRRRTLLVLLVLLVLPAGATAGVESPPTDEEAKVPLDLYVMSQCPWGVKAEDAIIPAAKSLEPFVDLNLYFIANPQPDTQGQPAPKQFTSLHGEPEVAENLRQVCAEKHVPDKYLDYITARNQNVMDPNWQGAAKTAGIDPAVIEACATGPEGAALLSDNLKAHKARGASASPTIDIGGAPYTGPRGPRSITLALCEALKAKEVTLPEACAKAEAMPPDPVPTAAGCGGAAAGQVAGGGCGGGAGGCGGGCAGGCKGGCGGGAVGAGAAPVASDLAFDIRVVVDSTCKVCEPKFLDLLKQAYPAARFAVHEAKSKEGKALITRVKATRLPLYLLDRAVEQTPNFQQMRRFYVKFGADYLVRPELAMFNVQLPRKRAPRHLDLFVSALSPASAKASVELLRFFQETKAKDLTFSLHFVVEEAAQGGPRLASQTIPPGSIRAAPISEIDASTPGPLLSAGGDVEIREAIRQACLFQHGSIGDLFTYLTCRSQDLANPDRADTCLVKTEPVTQCIEGPEGERLLRADARLVRELGIMGAPVLLWENRYGPFGFYELGSLERLVSERR